MLEDLFGWFQGFGLAFTLLGLFLLLVIDAMIFPTLPELFTVLAFLMDPTLTWGIILLATVCLAEVTGNTMLYLLVRRKQLPEFIQKAIKGWTGFIIFSDERIILLNRIAPVLPFTGAFMATCEWNYGRSMAYMVSGGILKYSALLALVGLLDYKYETETAQLFSLAAVAVVICVSLMASLYLRKRKARMQ